MNKHFVLPKVFFIGATDINIDALIDYLQYTDQEEFSQAIIEAQAEGLSAGEILCSFYAKLCYASLTDKKNKNISKTRDIQSNILNILESGHGSVIEHCQLNFVITNCSRVFTHELVRHRVGTAFSQTSGRYVRSDVLNVVIDPILEPAYDLFEEARVYLQDWYKKVEARLNINGNDILVDTKNQIYNMNILSLFDGMSCGQIALNRLGITDYTYYASEINKHAIRVTQKNYPKTIQLGSVTDVKGINLPAIDLLIGGSPCQGFSFSGKQLNFSDPRSKLFFEFARLINECKPKYWLLENVVMKKEFEDVITEHLGVNPVKINSSLVSAQNRERLYWTNIPNISQPEDKGINLTDILEDDKMISPSAIRGRKLNKATIFGRRLNENGKRDDYNKDIPITQCLEVRASNRNKSNCLTTVAKDNVLTTMPIGRHPDAFKNNLPFRYYTRLELTRLQTIPDNYFDGVASDNQVREMTGNGWTVDIIVHILRSIKSGSTGIVLLTKQ